nr:DUF1593 domain-containing protein [Planctomycetota bacterium]
MSIDYAPRPFIPTLRRVALAIVSLVGALPAADPPGTIGINVNGPAVTINGTPWRSWSQALSSGLSVSNATLWSGTSSSPLSPTPDAATRTVLESAAYRPGPANGQGLTLSQSVANGTYDVSIWVVENHQSNYRDMDLRIEGQTVASAIGDLPRLAWRSYGPYRVTVGDGALTTEVLRRSKGDPHLSGMLIVPVSGGSTPPPPPPPPADPSARPRLFVLTDISNEPDDAESLVRLLCYSNEFDIDALVATTSVHLRDAVRPDQIHGHIDEYAKVRGNLLLHASGFPEVAHLKARVSQGIPQYGMAGVGAGKDSPGSEALITAADRADGRPLNISVWGGANCLAQALWKVRATRSSAQLAAFIAKLRVYTIADQDDSGPWIRQNFPSVFYIVSPGSYQDSTWVGISGDRFNGFTGPDFNLVSNDWVDRHVQFNHGPLGASYPDIAFIMEGDTPSWFYFLPFGPGDSQHPEYGGWGGRYAWRDGIWTDTQDTVLGHDGQWYTNNECSVWRWRTDYQNDFEARMDWNVQPFSGANHPPVPVVQNGLARTVSPGQRVDLNASGTSDPDGNGVTYRWWNYQEPGTYDGDIAITGANGQQAWFNAPNVSQTHELHIMLTVTDQGAPALSRYRRVIVTVQPGVGQPTNQAPTVNAGSDRVVTLPASASLDGTVGDDGLPNGALNLAWTQLSGPGSVSFANAGAIDTTASFTAAGTYALRLTASDGALSASDDVMVTVSSQPAPGGVIAINVGGGAYTATDGTAYLADQHVTGGSTHATTDAIAGTDADPVYRSERYGAYTYAIPVANGSYDLRLQFAEIYQTANGRRVFDVLVEGQERVANLDIHAQVGARTAHDVVLPVSVS